MTLSPEPTTSEPESILSASSASIGPSEMELPRNVGKAHRSTRYGIEFKVAWEDIYLVISSIKDSLWYMI